MAMWVKMSSLLALTLYIIPTKNQTRNQRCAVGHGAMLNPLLYLAFVKKRNIGVHHARTERFLPSVQRLNITG